MFLSPNNTASQFQFRNYKLVKELKLPSFLGLSCVKMVSANPRLSMGCQDYYFTWFSDNHALNNIGQGLVFRSLVSANRWLRGIKTYRFPWYLTLVSGY